MGSNGLRDGGHREEREPKGAQGAAPRRAAAARIGSAASGDPAQLGRREFLVASTCLLGGLVVSPTLGRAESAAALPAAARAVLGKTELVYISPLHEDGRESRCHGEVWYFVDGEDVVIMTSSESWKARALASGRKRARVWVGDFGPIKSARSKLGAAPSFAATARIDRDPAAFARLMADYATRYASAWSKWEPRFRKGFSDGSRVMIRYSPG